MPVKPQKKAKIGIPLRQIKAAKLMVENGGNKRKALLEAGYSQAVADNPSKVMGTDTWKDLLEEYFPDSEMLRIGAEGMRATKVFTSHTEPDREVPDWANRHKFWESGMKLKGKFQDNIVNTQIIIPVLINATSTSQRD